MDTTKIQRIVRNYYDELYVKKKESLDNITFQNSMRRSRKPEE